MEAKKTNKKRQKSIRNHMMRAATIPAVFMLILIVIVSHAMMKNAIDNNIKQNLIDVANTAVCIMDRENPGDYTKVGDMEVEIYKGETLLNNNYDLIDTLVGDTNIGITFFYNDLRVISTLKYDNGDRIVSIAAHSKIKSEVLEKGKSKFYNNVTLNGINYYAYYKVIYNSDGSIAGMVEVVKPANQITKYILLKLIPVYIVGIIGIIMIAVFSYRSTGSFVSIISKLEKQFTKVSKGKLDGSLDPNILNRNDEFGNMAKAVLKMQTALKAMIELDTLTQINNRRRGDTRLATVINRARENGTEFNVAIGDIDYFKKVNDTYGHDAGDAVLVAVANILKKGMQGRGFVARWGGEEFLIVFDRMDYEASIMHLNRILERIRAEVVHVNGYEISVTMSFGITRGKQNDENNLVIKRADELLYTAKSTGRNQVISGF